MRGVLVGVGAMGRRHVVAMQDAGVDIVAACDASREALDRLVTEQQFPRERCYENADQMFAEARAELVVIATTAPSHCDLVCSAAEAGPSVILCEKPMATSLAECDRMMAACDQRQVRLAINHQMRFMTHYLAIRDIISADDFGGWSSLTVVAGNIGMAMNGVHYFELFRWLTGHAPQRISAWLDIDPVPNPRGAQFEDRAGSIRMVAPTGQRFYMEAGVDQGHGLRLVVAGRNGVLVVDELAGVGTLSVRRAEDARLPTSRYATDPESSLVQLGASETIGPTRAVLEAVMSGSDFPSGSDGRTALQCLLAAHMSSERDGEAVDLAGVDLHRRLPIA